MKISVPAPFPESGTQEVGAPARGTGSHRETGNQPWCSRSPQSQHPLSGPGTPTPPTPTFRGRVVGNHGNCPLPVFSLSFRTENI